MLRKNDEFECEILSNGSGGEGVCRIDGFAVFVPDTVKGDIVKVKILKVKSSYAFGKAMEIISPSPFRTEPLCSKYRNCGGCDIACMDYVYQLQMKQNTVVDAMYRIGGIKDITVEKTVGMDYPYHYRNKMQFPVGRDKDGKIVYGFYAKRSHNIVSAEECVTGKEFCRTIMETIISFMEDKKIEPYNEENHSGLIRHVFIRDSAYTGEIMVAIVINGESLPGADELIKRLTLAESKISGILLNVNRKKTNLIMGEKNILLYGKDTITDKIGNLEFSISPHSFYQINPVQTEKLYSLALDAAGDISDKTVFDLYCGTGTITLFMAQKAKKVIGVEIVEDAVKNACENAKRNGIENAFFYCGAVEDVIEELYEEGERADVVVLDPPRKGSDEKTLDIILKMNPEKIVYVSCGPATLARDLKFLENGGYKTQKVTPVDMFPQTVHVESVATLMNVGGKQNI
ncbi:MAG: 23S rRNA (uracil(1939)-C(5))-methyltransferase RlmD [Clostridia bacterium]|nr:23S rRNA (uracil(1939)-C(5))-methyltransferase RlmD [Clostridia bacterium]